MFGSDPLTIVHQQHGTLNDILKFAHVPRPFIGFERPQGTVGKAGNLLAVDWREAIDEHTRDQTDVPATLSQRGDRDRVGCQAIIEVGAETPFPDRIFQTRVRRQYDTNVALDRARLAQTLQDPKSTSL